MTIFKFIKDEKGEVLMGTFLILFFLLFVVANVTDPKEIESTSITNTIEQEAE